MKYHHEVEIAASLDGLPVIICIDVQTPLGCYHVRDAIDWDFTAVYWHRDAETAFDLLAHGLDPDRLVKTVEDWLADNAGEDLRDPDRLREDRDDRRRAWEDDAA